MNRPKISFVLHSAGQYLVERSGVFDGELYFSGEYIRVKPYAGGDAKRVLLRPLGAGDVQLGRVQGGQIFGVSGEHCCARRWEVISVVQQVSRPVVRRLFNVVTRPVKGAPARRAKAHSLGFSDAQLGLFASA